MERDAAEDIDIPGPGAYYNETIMSSFVNKQPHASQQFFGSTVERFSEKMNKEAVESDVGPGSYNVSVDSKKNRKLLKLGGQ